MVLTLEDFAQRPKAKGQRPKAKGPSPKPLTFSNYRVSVEYQTCESLAVIRGVTKHGLRRLTPLVIQLQIVFPGETDSAVNLYTSVGHLTKCVRAVCFGHRHTDVGHRIVLSYRPRCVISCRTSAFSK